jgi:hypothetical protein
VFDRLLGRLIEECESFGLATTMVIPSGLALDVQGAAFREGFARVAVDRQTLERLAPTVDLIPGMPVEVLIVTESRTIFDYISKPVSGRIWRSFARSENDIRTSTSTSIIRRPLRLHGPAGRSLSVP